MIALEVDNVHGMQSDERHASARLVPSVGRRVRVRGTDTWMRSPIRTYARRGARTAADEVSGRRKALAGPRQADARE